jgi:hypothetical protein
MATRNVLLVIADIGGYTHFIRAHKTALAHADLIVHKLLDSVVRASAGRLTLSKLEGDAAFLFAESSTEANDLAPIFSAMHRAFHATNQMIEKNHICGCAACIGACGLKLKVVAHQGAALVRRIRNTPELTGECVILAHRMLKNHVPLPEYALLSEDLARAAKPEIQCRLVPSLLTLEGFGEVPAAYLNLQDLAGAIPPASRAPLPLRVLAFLWHEFLALPYRVGLKKPLAAFRNVPL